MSLVGALFAWLEAIKDVEQLTEKESAKHGVTMTAFIVIFVAEWGDLTQILTANLAARNIRRCRSGSARPSHCGRSPGSLLPAGNLSCGSSMWP